MKITVQKFQQLYAFMENEPDLLERNIKLVQVLLDKSQEEVDAMTYKQFAKVSKRIAKLFDLNIELMQLTRPKKYIKCKGQWYEMEYDPKKINAGQYIELATFQKDTINNLHLILASIAKPIKFNWLRTKVTYLDDFEHEKKADDFLHADFKVSYHVAVFFYLLFKKCLKITLLSLKEEQVENLQSFSNDLLKTLDGLPMLRWSQSLKA